MDNSNRIHWPFQTRQGGAALVEFAIVFIVFLTLILAIIEFSLIIFDISRLTEATRAGARFATVNDPECNIAGKSGNYHNSSCSANTLDCSSPTNSVSVEINDCDFSASPLTPACAMVKEMDQIMLRDSVNDSVLSGSGKVTITYSCSGTGDEAIPHLVPVITVAAEEVQHPLMFTSIFSFYSPGNSIGPSFTLPSQKTSRVGEDMYTEGDAPWK